MSRTPSTAKIRPAALELGDTANFLALSVSTVERLVREGRFPKPRVLASRRVGWLVRELEAWLEERPVSEQLPPENTSRRAPAKKHSAPDAQTAS